MKIPFTEMENWQEILKKIDAVLEKNGGIFFKEQHERAVEDMKRLEKYHPNWQEEFEKLSKESKILAEKKKSE